MLKLTVCPDKHFVFGTDRTGSAIIRVIDLPDNLSGIDPDRYRRPYRFSVKGKQKLQPVFPVKQIHFHSIRDIRFPPSDERRERYGKSFGKRHGFSLRRMMIRQSFGSFLIVPETHRFVFSVFRTRSFQKISVFRPHDRSGDPARTPCKFVFRDLRLRPDAVFPTLGIGHIHRAVRHDVELCIKIFGTSPFSCKFHINSPLFPDSVLIITYRKSGVKKVFLENSLLTEQILQIFFMYIVSEISILLGGKCKYRKKRKRFP